uniref:Uncharacterized protein n=1 Tax=Rhizophora mucronata TaxID=61149 RepID=A0A2P2QJZ1_RHIMU
MHIHIHLYISIHTNEYKEVRGPYGNSIIFIEKRKKFNFV